MTVKELQTMIRVLGINAAEKALRERYEYKKTIWNMRKKAA